MADSVVDNAVRDARKLADLARDTVKNEIMESMSPGIKRLVDRAIKQQLGAHVLSEGDTHMAGKDDELEIESIAGVFPGINEAEDEVVEAGDPLAEADEVPYLDEMESLEGGLDEEIEIDESALSRHVEEAIQLEVQMSKGFKDLDLSGKEEVDQGNAVHDVKSGEHPFEGETPPAKKDWTVKEIKALIRKGLSENDQLRRENRRLKEDRAKLVEHLRKSNLFNSKMNAVQAIFSENTLNGKQKRSVVESIDKAKTVTEVKNIAGAITNTLGKRQKAVQEARTERPKGNGSRVRTAGVDTKVVRESVDRSAANGDSAMYGRWQVLSGLIK